MPKFSIAIPTHQMPNRLFFLKRNLDSLWNQTLQDFDIIVTDNSDDGEIERMCEYYGGINYYRNPVKGMAQNTNEAIRRSTGELVKVLYLDDYLAHDKALEMIWDNFEGWWLASGCEHDDGVTLSNQYIPRYSLDIKNGINTIGSPSVITIKNDHPLLFDENMTWLLDVDYYKRLYAERGAPTILEDINVVIGIHPGQMTNVLSDALKAHEHNYLTQKHV